MPSRGMEDQNLVRPGEFNVTVAYATSVTDGLSNKLPFNSIQFYLYHVNSQQMA